MKALYMHPATLGALHERTEHAGYSTTGECRSFAGLPIITSTAIREFCTEWQFPDEPFVEYEPHDEEWCRFFGFGADVETNERAVFEIDWSAWSRPALFGGGS